MNRLVESAGLAVSLHSPWFFRNLVRRDLYKRAGPDPEDVHKLALSMLDRYQGVLDAHKECFSFPELVVDIKGMKMQPFGTAAGIDKNGDALVPFSYVFGFQTLGTVLVDERQGNNRPRVAVGGGDAYNAQGFPSMGMNYALGKLRSYRDSHATQKPVIASICGLPHVIREEGAASFVPNRNRVVTNRSSPMMNRVVYKEFAEISGSETERALEHAYSDTELLLREFNPYADGFEWNPFSPNTSTLALLRRPDIFREYARLVREIAGGKLSLVKMGPYEEAGKDPWLALVEGWMGGGGDGVTAVNTYIVPKEKVPSESWGYPSAGRSGNFLRPYRLRAVSDTHQAFPDAVIFATGGISDGEDAYDTFIVGADVIEGYTPFTYHGLGLNRKLMQGVSREMKRDGYRRLEELRTSVRKDEFTFSV